MKVIGIVGPAGSGKSTVARMLARRAGIARVDCDELAWSTYRPGGPAYARVVARFGGGILARDGSVDRFRLATVALSDPRAKADLEAIVHPEVMAAVRRAIADHEKKGTRFLLVEGALLLSSSHVDRSLFDAFVWLDVPEEERRERLLASGLPFGAVVQRLSAQRDLQPPRDPKVYVMDAQSPPANVAGRVLDLLRSLERR
ncbi:MAG: dephospho-CoA kinase [Candidatus Acetothermia bacterium]|jgi:dephospho-CoA kinase|nr:dephospho-CoA kinase [Candidatus Acetothermia bacterium]